jgi:SAM-dependent methyltransferase
MKMLAAAARFEKSHLPPEFIMLSGEPEEGEKIDGNADGEYDFRFIAGKRRVFLSFLSETDRTILKTLPSENLDMVFSYLVGCSWLSEASVDPVAVASAAPAAEATSPQPPPNLPPTSPQPLPTSSQPRSARATTSKPRTGRIVGKEQTAFYGCLYRDPAYTIFVAGAAYDKIRAASFNDDKSTGYTGTITRKSGSDFLRDLFRSKFPYLRGTALDVGSGTGAWAAMLLLDFDVVGIEVTASNVASSFQNMKSILPKKVLKRVAILQANFLRIPTIVFNISVVYSYLPTMPVEGALLVHMLALCKRSPCVQMLIFHSFQCNGYFNASALEILAVAFDPEFELSDAKGGRGSEKQLYDHLTSTDPSAALGGKLRLNLMKYRVYNDKPPDEEGSETGNASGGFVYVLPVVSRCATHQPH